MTPDEIKELKELIEFLKENGIGEFELRTRRPQGSHKVRAARQGTACFGLDLARLGQLLSPGQHAPAAGSQGIHAVAPFRGGFRRGRPARGRGGSAAHRQVADRGHVLRVVFSRRPAFVKIGDEIENGQVLCIVEAMKLMNEIESDAAGEVVKRLVTNGQPVEYGQPLFALRLISAFP
jgi:acetyl-CoA carboxylase biotin carboxyl carrier protein